MTDPTPTPTPESRLNEAARNTLRDAGISEAEWARRNYFESGVWYGDACGCLPVRLAEVSVDE